MKKLWIILAVFAFVLVGCNNETTNEKDEDPAVVEEDENKNSEDLTEKEDKPQETTDEDIDESNNDDISNKDEQKDEDQDLEPLYKIVGISDFKPIDDANPNAVLITIDDAPDEYALEMATTLKELNVPAIFFVNGIFINNEEKREVIKQIHDMGFAIGNHTHSHKNLKKLTEEEQYEEIMSVNDLVEEIIGEKPKFFRAPHGANTDYAKELIKSEEMLLMNWTYGYDYFEPYMDADKLAEAMITGEGPEVGVPYSLLKPGANLLMHDRAWTNEALPTIIEGLKEQGYDFINPETILIENDEEA
ncbi:polysaccharide deacetylase family protein [Bacillaceae bacterium W0354]